MVKPRFLVRDDEVPRKLGRRILCAGTEVKFTFIRAHRMQFKITRMYDVLDVSTSGYYDWLVRPDSKRSQRHKALVNMINTIHQHHREIYGSPRVHRELVDQGVTVGENTVAMLMRRHKIQSKMHKRFVVTTNSRHGYAPTANILNRQFFAS